MMMFAKNLKYLRELKGLKQADMLDACGFKQSTWNGYERGVSTPNIEDFIKISDYFRISESDLLHTEIGGHNVGVLRDRYNEKNSGPTTQETGNGEAENRRVEEPTGDYGNACRECAHMKNALAQKDETIAALKGQVDALQIAVEALKRVVG